MGSRIEWSALEEKALRKFYPLLGSKVTKDDLEHLFPDRKWEAIQQKASKLRLVRKGGGVDEDFMKRLSKAVRSI